MSADHTFVSKISEDGLTWSIWRFWKDNRDEQVYLDEYIVKTRATKRHGFKPVSGFDRLPGRANHTLTLTYNLPYEDVPMPQDVVDEALESYRKQITFAGKYKR